MKTSIKLSFCVFSVFFALILSAGKIGPGVAEYKGNPLSFETGSHDYFVMFKSLLDNTAEANLENPQANACKEKSSFNLSSANIPADALIDRAFLVWTSAIDKDKFDFDTDNSVTLSFEHSDKKITHTAPITASRIAKLNDPLQDFEFEGFTNTDGGYFTYRVEVTDFFNEIHKKGNAEALASDGAALLGSYTVSDMQCSQDINYVAGTSMMGGWSIILVYKSETVRPKKIYIYSGFQMYQYEQAPIDVSDFVFPSEPTVKLTLMALEGDPNLVNPHKFETPEGLYLKGEGDDEGTALLSNKCNPQLEAQEYDETIVYTEVYNSISSVYDWNSGTPQCIGGDPGKLDLTTLEYGIDVDTFIFNNKLGGTKLDMGDKTMRLTVSTNEDTIYTNFLVLSVDTKAPDFDIKDKREKNFCSCSKEKDKFCLKLPFYYTITVQNNGTNPAKNVTVADPLPKDLKYIAGTAEIGKRLESTGNKIVWEAVADDAGAFPFQKAKIVAETMRPCGSDSCDTVFVRFQVQPSEALNKSAKIDNSASISADEMTPYKTNSDVPLRLRADNSCVQECKPDRCSPECGGCGETLPDENLGNDSDQASDNNSGNNDSDTNSTQDSDNTAISGGDESSCGCSVIK